MVGMIECGMCKNKIARDARVCHFCGKKVSKVSVGVFIGFSIAVCVVYWLVG